MFSRVNLERFAAPGARPLGTHEPTLRALPFLDQRATPASTVYGR
jgi:hypothetical protein